MGLFAQDHFFVVLIVQSYAFAMNTVFVNV